MSVRRYTLIEIIRAAPCWLYEAMELTDQGRCYLYRYDPLEGAFFRATLPAGAARLHFRRLGEFDKLPLGGWVAVEQRQVPRRHLRIVGPLERASA